MILDFDDTVDVVHGHQQFSLFNAHEDERCFKPIHVYDVATSRPVMVVLRPGKTPSGKEVRGHVRRLIRRIRMHWPDTAIICRSPRANQMRLILHTAAYWLMLTVRDAIAKTEALAKAEFNTLRLALIKIGARIIETASRVRIAFSAACPNAALFRHIAAALQAGP